MNPQETAIAEFFFHTRNRFSQQMSRRLVVQEDVVSLGLYSNDICGIDKQNSAIGFYRNSGYPKIARFLCQSRALWRSYRSRRHWWRFKPTLLWVRNVAGDSGRDLVKRVMGGGEAGVHNHLPVL